MWTARIDALPDHPIARGVTPFETHDEWYINIRAGDRALANAPAGRDGAAVHPILVAVPSDEVRAGPYVWPHGPYPDVVAASGRPETLLWTIERPDGGRGFGLTGGHYHRNWGNDPFRRTVLNALVWLTGVEVPADGIESAISDADLARDLDPKA
jgi:hypothetical protein